MKKWTVISWSASGTPRDFETVGYYSSEIMAILVMQWEAWTKRKSGRVAGVLETKNYLECVDEMRDEWTKQLSGEGKW